MSPAMAETLFGRIGFVLTTAVGAIGRAATQPLLQRAHESGGGRSLPFTPAMQHMLDFFRVLLPAIPPLAVRCGPDQADDLHRVEVYVNTIALLTVEEETGEETYRGALAMLKALRKAKSLNTSELLLKVLEQALNQARSARLGEYEDAVSLGEAYSAAARTIQKSGRDIEVNRLASSGSKKAQKVDNDPPETMQQMLNSGAATAKAKKAAKDKELADKNMIEVRVGANKHRKTFKIMPGGNPKCPSDCNRGWCKKDDQCGYNHQNK